MSISINCNTKFNNPYSPFSNKSSGFGANHRIVKDSAGNILYRTTTFSFRRDLEWDKFIKFLSQKYNNVEHVNIINHAASNGAETYSLVAKLSSVLKEKSEKFFPVLACDIDKDNIKMARNGRLKSYLSDACNIKRQLGVSADEFFSFGKPDANKKDYDLVIKAKPCLKQNIQFKKSDIFKDVEKLPKSNTVLLCRNFWLYLTLEQKEELAEKLSKQFDDTCLLVTGEYDNYTKGMSRQFDLEKFFEHYGFRKTSVKHVWIKRKLFKKLANMVKH